MSCRLWANSVQVARHGSTNNIFTQRYGNEGVLWSQVPRIGQCSSNLMTSFLSLHTRVDLLIAAVDLAHRNWLNLAKYAPLTDCNMFYRPTPCTTAYYCRRQEQSKFISIIPETLIFSFLRWVFVPGVSSIWCYLSMHLLQSTSYDALRTWLIFSQMLGNRVANHSTVAHLVRFMDRDHRWHYIPMSEWMTISKSITPWQ